MNDTIEVVDGDGTFYRVIITATDPRKTSFQIIDQQQEAAKNYHIHLAVSPTKRPERIEWLVEKVVELGVGRVSFVDCDHSERHKLRIDRLQRKAISAMKQSLKATLPIIDDVIPLTEFFPLVDPEATRLLAHLNKDSKPLSQAIEPRAAYCILIGPEGDFSPEELEKASQAGFQQVTLGNSRLRTETAALTAVVGLHLFNE